MAQLRYKTTEIIIIQKRNQQQYWNHVQATPFSQNLSVWENYEAGKITLLTNKRE